MKRTICLLLIILTVFALTACGKDDPQPVPYYTTDEETFSIETRYCVLSYPTKWKDATTVDITDTSVYTVSFSAGAVKLFDLMFGGTEGYKLGTLPYNGEVLTISLISYDIDCNSMSEEQFFSYCAMQEDVNVIVSRLIENYGFVVS